MFKSDGNCQGGSDPYNSESGMGTISYRFFAVFSAAVQLLPLLPVNSFHERNQHEQQDNSCEPYYYSENHLSQKHRQTHTGAEKERPENAYGDGGDCLFAQFHRSLTLHSSPDDEIQQ